MAKRRKTYRDDACHVTFGHTPLQLRGRQKDQATTRWNYTIVVEDTGENGGDNERHTADQAEF